MGIEQSAGDVVWRPDLGAPGIGRLLIDEAVNVQNVEVVTAIAEEMHIPVLPNPRLGLLYYSEDLLRANGIRSGAEALEMYGAVRDRGKQALARRESHIRLSDGVYISARGVLMRRVVIPGEVRGELYTLMGALRRRGGSTLCPVGNINCDDALMRIGQVASRVRNSSMSTLRAAMNEVIDAAPWEEQVVAVTPLQAIEPDPLWRQLDESATWLN